MITQAELIELVKILKEQGVQVQVDPEELEGYFPEVEDSFYVPKVPSNFYYDAKGLRDAGRIGDMRGLTSVNSKVFRRLLGLCGI